jgi:bifunctional non-homologous end joining protein LigD
VAPIHSTVDLGAISRLPVLLARIEFLHWTPENRLRHPRFAGIRSDKDAREIVGE